MTQVQTYKELQFTAKRLIESKYSLFLFNHLLVSRGNVSQSARAAGMDRSNFLRMCARYNIKPSDFRKKDA